jgi:predicted Zn-dependent protease
MLPYSRNHETEADKIGLVLMAVQDTILIKQSFWTRMASSNGQAPPEFLSSHPSATRI